MLCLILLKKYAQVDLQKMISVFSMAKCESILKTLQLIIGWNQLFL